MSTLCISIPLLGRETVMINDTIYVKFDTLTCQDNNWKRKIVNNPVLQNTPIILKKSSGVLLSITLQLAITEKEGPDTMLVHPANILAIWNSYTESLGKLLNLIKNSEVKITSNNTTVPLFVIENSQSSMASVEDIIPASTIGIENYESSTTGVVDRGEERVENLQVPVGAETHRVSAIVPRLARRNNPSGTDNKFSV